MRRICPLSHSVPPPPFPGSISRRFEEVGGRRNLARQRRLYRLNGSSSFGVLRTAPLSHIRPAAATLASPCLNPDTNEIDRTLVRDQIIRHAHRYGSATINHRNKR